MRTATLVTQWIVRLAGITQIVLGILFWTGRAINLVPLHMSIGFLVVLGLWTIAILALVTRVRRGLALFALFWGLALPALGIPQAGILIGEWHWVIRTIHLLMGLTALGMADALAAHVLGSRPRSVPAPRVGAAS